MWDNSQTNFDRNLAVIIGIDRYQNDNIHDLSTPVSDAIALANLLENGYGYKPENVLLLVDEQATLSGLQTLLTDTLPNQLKPTEGDRLIFYFAGHGLPKNSDEGPTGYLVPQDAQRNQENSFLPMKEVYDVLSQLQCHHLLVILDCCFAGTFRWASSRKLIPELETISREHYDRFIRFPAWQVITSAAHNQEALDFVKLSQDPRGRVDGNSHSPFALALLEALQDSEPDSEGRRYQNADYTKDGVIAAHELIVYLEKRVSQLSQERQAPGLYPLKREYDKGEFIFVKPDFDPRQLSPAPELNEENNPYRGLKPFEERHAQFFFGRQKLVEELGDRLAKSRRPLTVVLGISGSGKSSLVKAGLLPHLRQKQEKEESAQSWYILAPMRPGKSPFLELAKAVLPVANSHLIERLAQVSFLDPTMATILDSKSAQKPKADTQERPSGEKAFETTKLAQLWHTATPEAKLLLIVDYFERLQGFCHQPQEQAELSQLHEEIDNALQPLAKTLQQNPESFINAIDQWSQDHPHTKILLVIDQLEELITMSQEDRESEKNTDSQEQKDWQRFLSLLRITLAKYRQQLHVIVTLRSDFEPRFLNSALKAHWKSSRFPVRGMNSDELRDAIEGPALKQALYFEPPELVGKLIDEVGQMPGALPLLSFTLSELYIRLYERWNKNKSTDRALRIKDYEELGGLAGALTRRASQEYDNLVRDFGEASGKAYQATMRRVILRMVTIEEGEVARRRVLESELVYPDTEENKRVAQVCDLLVKARLLVKGQETGEPYIEPAHDFLMRGWDNLQKWLKEEQKESLFLQRRLTPAAVEWENAKNKDEEQPKGILDKAKLARDWFDQKLFSVENLLSKIPARLARLLNRSQNQQEQSREKPAQFLWDTNPYLDILDKELHSHENWLNQVESEFVQESILKKCRDDIRKRDLAIVVFVLVFLVFGAAGFLSTQSQITELLAIAARAKKLLAEDPVKSTILAIQASGKNDDLSRYSLNTIKMLDSVQSSLLETVQTVREKNRLYNEHGIRVFVLSPDKKRIVTGDFGGKLQLWDLQGKQLSKPVSNGHTDKINSLAFCNDNKANYLASAGEDGQIGLWKMENQYIYPLSINSHQNHDPIKSVAFLPTSKCKKIVSGRKEHIQLWNITIDKLDNKLKLFLSQPEKSVGANSIAFLPQKDVMIIGNSKKEIRWGIFQALDKKENRIETKMEIHSVAVNPHDKNIFIGGNDGKITLWTLKDKPIQLYEKTLTGHTKIVSFITFSSCNKDHLISGSWDNTVRLWTLEYQKELQVFKGHTGDITRVDSVCEPNKGDKIKTIISTSSNDKTMRFWDVNSPLFRDVNFPLFRDVNSPLFRDVNSPLFRDVVPNNICQSFKNLACTISKDHKYIITVDDDKKLELLNPQLKPINKPLTLIGHEGKVTSVDLSANRKFIVTGGNDGEIHLWSLLYKRQFPWLKETIELGEPIGQPLKAGGSVKLVEFESNNLIFSQTENGKSRKWEIGWKSWLKLACDQLKNHSHFIENEEKEVKEAQKICSKY